MGGFDEAATREGGRCREGVGYGKKQGRTVSALLHRCRDNRNGSEVRLTHRDEVGAESREVRRRLHTRGELVQHDVDQSHLR
jgi:hypothetical protein